ncbi:hypothetical protein FA95DRAFT_872207 [Auriscalpium vulgare]|uniref:Uncharacterized protein n=1 Tax=Auriscalpium vulgare TaxID=40419 RepID=A0ACB8RYU9_9AGAM|nr:hypothetical protein FA95DRAFT_872207 [Auriscalpium vulgare]
MSPTPTAGLGGLGNLSVPPAPQSSRDRMRNAWSSIRDRFGLNNRHASPEQTPAPSPPPPSTGNAGNTEGADPRTQLLAEMARAFHLGMGLDNPDGSNANAAGAAPAPASTPTADTVLDAERPMPPEDSFERFLIDLQTDLRRTLADDHSPTSPANTDRPPSPTTEDMPPAIYPLYERIPSAGDEPGIGDDDLPPLADGSDSDIDELEHVEVHDAQEDVESTHGQEGNAPQNAASIPIIGAHTASGSERRPGGGINWWRMYRFPPMTVPANQAQSSPALPTSLPATLASAASPLPVLTPLNHATATSAQTSATTTGVSEGTPSSDGETNIIVPVIVVGLQSVNGTNAQRGTHEDPTLAQGEEGLFAGHSHGEDPSDHDHDDMPAEDDRGHADMDNERADTPTNGARGRSWHSRAADRLRGMRNRRTSNAETRQNEGNGSTTFFIYVIGGALHKIHSVYM